MENIKTIALKYITFSKDLQLVYFEFLGKRYDIKNAKDIYHELVKFLFEVYKKNLVEENKQLTLKIYGFTLVLHKREDLPTYTKTRLVFGDWYLITHFSIAQLEQKIREVVSAFDFDDEKIIIGYYPKVQGRKEEQERQTFIEEKEEQEEKMGQNSFSIKTTTLKNLTFSDNLNFAYFELWGKFYGKYCEIKNIKDFYQELVKIFIEKYPNCLTYNKNQLNIEKDNFILRLYKEKYFSNFALKFGYIRNIFEDWYLYVQYPIFEFEQKIKRILSAMELNEEDVVIGYYPNEQKDQDLERQEEQKEEQVEKQIEEQIEEDSSPTEIENTDSNIQTTTLRDITFSKEIKLAYCEIFGNKYSIKGARDIYCELVKFFIEKYPNSLTYEGNKLILDRYAFSLELSKIEDLPKWASPRHIIDEYYLYTNYDLPRLEKKIREISFFMDLDEKDIIIGYYPNNAVNPQPLQIEQSKQVEVLKQNVIPQEIEKPKVFTSFDSSIQTTTLKDITFSRELKLAYCEIFGKKYNIKIERDLYQLLVKLFVEKHPNLLIYEDYKIIVYDKIKLYKYSYILNNRKKESDIEKRYRHIFADWYLDVDRVISELEDRIRKIVYLMDISEEEVIIGYYSNNYLNNQPRQIAQPKQLEVLKQNVIPQEQEIEKTNIFTNFDSNIQTTTLRDITFSRDVKLAYVEILGKRYDVKRARDIYCELVKFFIEKYKDFWTVEDNKIILDQNVFLWKYEDITVDIRRYRHIFDDWYLYINLDTPTLAYKIRKVVSALNISEEQVIIGYYPNDAVSFPAVEVKEMQANYPPVKIEPEQPKEDMLLFSSDLKKVKNKFFDYLLNVKNFEEVKAKNYVLAFNFYCYSNNISFSLNNVAYFEEQIANDELLSSNEIIANQTREIFPVFLAFVQYYQEQKEKELEIIKTNCVSILKDEFSDGYRVGEFAKLDYRQFCKCYKEEFHKELELEREELNDFLKSFTFLYEDTVYLPEFVISKEAKSNLFDFIKKCFSEHKFVYYDTIYNKLFSELYGGIITTPEILKKYLLEINGEEIEFKDNGDYISVPNENIDSDYIFKHLENWLFETGRVVKMEEIENNFFNMVSDKTKTDRIKDFIKNDKNIILNSYSKENGSDYFHSDIIYLTNHDLDKINEFFKNIIQNTNVQFISDEDFFRLLRNNEEFSERYNFISDFGLKRYFQIKLYKTLRFRNQKVELRSSYVSYEDIIENFVESKKKFELEDVKNLMKDLSYSSFDQIYQKISECAVRISENDFVSNENIDFVGNIDEIDSLISEFCGDKKFVFIKDVTVFAGFPNVGYAWNKFLLESYVNRYSRRYKLLNTVFFIKNVYGVIVDKKSNLTLNDCLADVLLDSSLRVEEEAVKYLVENDYLYKVQNISDVMAKVRDH